MTDEESGEINYVYRDPTRGRMLEGQIAVVTGGSRGIGGAIARLYALNGAKVAIAHYDADTRSADALTEAILAEGGDCFAMRADLTDATLVKELFQAVEARWGSLSILVNNAGVTTRTPFQQLSDEEWDYTHKVNLKSQYLCSQAAARLMGRGSGESSMIHVSSIRSQRAFSADSAYIASKGGVEALTRALAVELAPQRIRVNCIAPGAIETDFNRDRLRQPDIRAQAIRSIPLRRLGTPLDVANIALFLASPLSAYLTGAVIPVDGGQIIQG